MKDFLEYDRPVITAMIKDCSSIEAILEEIKFSLENGAEAFGLEICLMKKALRTADNFKTLFNAMGDKPCYITNYQRTNVETGQTDEELFAEMLMAVECGARLVDIRGDMFLQTARELTMDEAAVKKQKEAIQQVHSMGAQVLMSTHALKYLSPEQILYIAKQQEERGADIVKIVTDANSKKEQYDCFKTTYMLEENLKIPFLFLCNGTESYLHRLYAPAINGCMFLCSADPNAVCGEGQPPIKVAVEMLKLSLKY